MGGVGRNTFPGGQPCCDLVFYRDRLPLAVLWILYLGKHIQRVDHLSIVVICQYYFEFGRVEKAVWLLMPRDTITVWSISLLMMTKVTNIILSAVRRR